jgi:hypothetical protein
MGTRAEEDVRPHPCRRSGRLGTPASVRSSRARSMWRTPRLRAYRTSRQRLGCATLAPTRCTSLPPRAAGWYRRTCCENCAPPPRASSGSPSSSSSCRPCAPPQVVSSTTSAAAAAAAVGTVLMRGRAEARRRGWTRPCSCCFRRCTHM